MADIVWKSGKVGIGFAGITHILFFMPLCWISAEFSGASFIRTLFLIDVPEHIATAFRQGDLPQFSIPGDVGFLAALGVVYGLTCLTLLLLDIAFGEQERQIARVATFIITVNGFFFGFILTLVVCDVIIDIADIDLSLAHIYVAKFLYLYFSFIAVMTVKIAIPVSPLRKAPFEILLDGLFGIVATLIITLGFDEGLAAALSGPIFLVLAYLVMFFWGELFVARFAIAGFFAAISVSTSDTNFVNIRDLMSQFSRTFRKAIVMPFEQLVMKADEAIAMGEAQRVEYLENSEVMRFDRDALVFTFLLCLIWPYPFVALYAFFL